MRCRTNNPGGKSTLHHLQWHRQHGDLPAGSRESNGILYINNVVKSDEGLYSCVGYSQTGDILFTVKTYLSVHDLPHITLTPKRQVVRPGQDAYILCQATGTQPISVSWSPISRNFPASAYSNGGELRFNNIQLSDAGKYRCTAVGPVGVAESVAEVVVNGKCFYIFSVFEESADRARTCPCSIWRNFLDRGRIFLSPPRFFGN